MGKGKGAARVGTTDGKGGMNIIVLYVITIPTMYNKYRAIKMKDKTS